MCRDGVELILRVIAHDPTQELWLSVHFTGRALSNLPCFLPIQATGYGVRILVQNLIGGANEDTRRYDQAEHDELKIRIMSLTCDGLRGKR